MSRTIVLLLTVLTFGCTAIPAAPPTSKPPSTISMLPPQPPSPPRMVTVPDLLGLSAKGARSALASLGLNARQNSTITWRALPNRVFSQSSYPGGMVDPGTTVVFTVARVVREHPDCPRAFGNPWAFSLACGSFIYHPPADFCDFLTEVTGAYCVGDFYNAAGYVMQCRDGNFSKSGGKSGSCSSHDGNWRPLLNPA
jgi:PASTA domain-containing protein